MELFILSFFLFTCCLGISVIIISFLLYARYRKKAILFFSFFLISLNLIILAFTIDVFATIGSLYKPYLSSILLYFKQWFETLGIVTNIMVSPFFFHRLLGIPLKKIRKTVFFSVSILSIVVMVCNMIFGPLIMLLNIIHLALFGTILYCLVFTAVNVSTIGDKILKKAIKILFIVTGIFFPLFILDTNPHIFPMFPEKQPYSTLSLPLYFFIINLLGILFSFKFFARPAYLENGEISTHFNDIYKISKREAEIVSHLIKGLSNKEIGEKLFISYKTVENHLYRIYQKTKVRNRVELTNLIQSNKMN